MNRFKETEKAKEPFGKVVFDWVEELCFCAIIIIIILTFLFKVMMVSGISMLPNYLDGDRVIVNCINFEYQPGDVVIVTEVLDTPIIKRVIATEGQTVDIDKEKGIVYIDGKALDEEIYGLENGITTETFTSDERIDFPATVPENCVFVLGDNRKVSEDSRYKDVGMIDVRNILGKAIFRITPFDRFGMVE